MCKKLVYLVSFVLVLGSVSNAEDIQWTDLGADHLWSTPDNWDLGRVPTLDDEVLIDVPAAAEPNGPVIQDGIDAKAKGIWTEAPGEPMLTMTGGTLEVADWIWWGDGADSFGIWNMSGGTVDVVNEFELGWGGGAGTLTMTGGTISARKAKVPASDAAFGELFLYGGTYNVTGEGKLDVKDNGLIDITEGTLMLEGDDTAKVNDLIAAGLITAYGGKGLFKLDYDIRNPGKTTLTAIIVLSEALDTTLSFTTDGSADWFSQTTTFYYDGDAAQSGGILHGQESWMQTTVSGAGTVSFFWKVSSESNYDYLEFYIDGSLQDGISGSADWHQMTYTITALGLHTLEWRYVKDISVNEGDDCGWIDQVAWEEDTQPPPPSDPLSEALDTTLSFTTNGSADWFSQTTTSYYDGDAAQSGGISHDQESWMQTTVSGAGTVSFHWKVSSEVGFDYLEFYIDGVLQDRISGSADWHKMTYTIAALGFHTLEWRYVKDYSRSEGDDCGRVDKLEVSGLYPPLDPSLVIYYSFDDVGKIVGDQTGKGHDGVVVGDVTAEPEGMYGGAANFANGGYLDLDGPNFPAEDIPTSAFTLAAWTNVDGTSSKNAIFNAKATDPNAGHVWLIHPEIRIGDNDYRFTIRGAGSTKIGDIDHGKTGYPPSPGIGDTRPNEWVHVAMTYSKADARMTLYVDGQIVLRRGGDGAGDPIDNAIDIAGNWDLGARVGYNIDNKRPFTGLMDEFRMYTRELSQDEILKIMQGI